MGKQITVTFEEWVKDMFERPVTDPPWYHASNADSESVHLSPAVIVAYITRAFENAKRVFTPISNAQLNQGLYYLVSHASEIMFALLDNRVLWSDRQRCILSFFTLFEQVFAVRCSARLAHLDEPDGNPLNEVCYMWWDIFPFWGQLVRPARPEIDELFLDVMTRTLDLASDACRESALHGLGHLPSHRDKVEDVIDKFILRYPNLRPELKAYAINARDGAVQ